MISINPYFNFMGNTEEAMNFYKSVFGGEFTTFQRFTSSPGHEKMPKADQSKIMNMSLPMGSGVIMATDTLESMGMNTIIGNNVYICVNTESEEETVRFFNKLSEGGDIEMPLNKAFWGAYCGMCRDKFGMQWMINYDLKLEA